jgi:antitoxin HicB
MKTEDYLSLPYTIEVTRDEGDYVAGWFARVVELPGCMTQADSFVELDEMIKDAMTTWIASALEDGQPIPLPQTDEANLGRLSVKIPKSLHQELLELAVQEGVNLNTLVNVSLGKEVSRRKKAEMDKFSFAA